MKTYRSLALLLCATIAPAQDVQTGSWKNVEAIAPGSRIEVVAADRQRISGEFSQASAEGLVVRTAAGELNVPRSNARRISVRPKKRGKYIAIGAAVGGGAGGGILGGVAAAQQKPGAEEGYPAVFAAGGAVVGAGIGAIVGWLASGSRTVYEAK